MGHACCIIDWHDTTAYGIYRCLTPQWLPLVDHARSVDCNTILRTTGRLKEGCNLELWDPLGYLRFHGSYVVVVLGVVGNGENDKESDPKYAVRICG